MLDIEGGDKVNVAADEFPPNGVTATRYYLDGRSRTLTAEAPTDAIAADYDVDANPNAVSFIVKFDQETVMVGYPKARLWVEARGADDMDLFLLVQKLDAYGTPLQQFTGAPNQNARVHDLTDHAAPASCATRGSATDVCAFLPERLDEELSTDDVPAHTFDQIEKLSTGEIVDIGNKSCTANRSRVLPR